MLIKAGKWRQRLDAYLAKYGYHTCLISHDEDGRLWREGHLSFLTSSGASLGDIRFCWYTANTDFEFSLGLDRSEGTVSMFLGVPFFVTGASVAHLFFSDLDLDWGGWCQAGRHTYERVLTFRINHERAHYSLFTDDGGWASAWPKWAYVHFRWDSILDWILGKAKHSTTVGSKEVVEVPMPEGTYLAQVTLQERVWKRSRWPWPRRTKGSEIEVEGGVPVPGKGENSWDCGEDAIHAQHNWETTVEGSVAALIRSVLQQRRRYGGKNWRPDKVRRTGVGAIERERTKQLCEWSSEHDDDHVHGELVHNAVRLLHHNYPKRDGSVVEDWGLVEKFGRYEMKSLAVAGALLAAEIDRLQREEDREHGEPAECSSDCSRG